MWNSGLSLSIPARFGVRMTPEFTSVKTEVRNPVEIVRVFS